MSEAKLISPMLDNFVMGDPISDHNGVRCCPAMEQDSDNRYIVKIISTPATQVQLDALLLSGAYTSKEDALAYFKALTDGIVEEVDTLNQLAQLEGFEAFEKCQVVPMDNGETGYDVYLLSTYRNTLQRHLRHKAMTHLEAINLGLDLCAALACCRRSGFLFVNLKPGNIYISENGYRIGDLGFVRLNGLKYASLPDRYRSQYTAPEIADAYSALNTTIDIYAAGLILYQVFNNGILPFSDVAMPEDPIPAPAYANYEMAEIILKACAPDPQMRWQNPIEMGQALVSYMQRNGAHNTPITPVSNQPITDGEPENGNFEAVDEALIVSDEQSDEGASAPAQNSVPIDDPELIAEDSIYTEDEEGNLTFISDPSDDETLPGENSDIIYSEVTDEVSDILQQADELIAHHAPDPVVQPEPIDVPIPPPIVPDPDTPNEEAETEDTVAQEERDNDNPTADKADDAFEGTEEPGDVEETNEPHKKKKSAMFWVQTAIIAFIVIALAVLGFFFYKNYYLQTIDAITLESNEYGSLTVVINSPVKDEKLSVICSDTYGNQLKSTVSEGRATFTGLAPNSAYTVKVVIDGFHRLTGDISAAYTTPILTEIVQLTAVTGAEDGTIILGFAIEGPDTEQWKISYNGDDVLEKQAVFAGHTVTLDGFTVGNSYKFSLEPVGDLRITGQTEVTYTASKVLKAEDLMISSCKDGVLTAAWSSPEGTKVEGWTVRCYNDSGFDKTTVSSGNTASFEIPDMKSSYTVEVTAAGMSVSERTFAKADTVSVKNFKAEYTQNGIFVSWEPVNKVENQEWNILCSVDGSPITEYKCQNETSLLINPAVPGSNYKLVLNAVDSDTVIGGILKYKTPEATTFEGYGVKADNMDFSMCRTPSYSGWNRYDVRSSDYTTTFTTEENASFVIHVNSEYDTSSDDITSLFVIRNKDGQVVSILSSTEIWRHMWYRNYCELDIPQLPQTPGEYSVTVFFNGQFVKTVDFVIS